VHKLRRALVGLLGISTAAASVLAIGATSATAASAPGAAVAAQHAHRLTHASDDSNWGGYAVTGGTYDSVTGNWTVPSLNCSATKGDVSFWSGLDGWTSSSVEQIGLDAVCASGGKIEYNPWVEMYPANSIYFTETVKAGDEMTSSVTTNGSGSFTLVLADPTQGWTKTYTKTLTSAPLSSAEVIVEAIGSQDVSPCPNFGSVAFTDVTANGGSFADEGTVQTTNLERSGTLLTQDGALDGSSFGVTWLHK
jgi:Peptidase A4 family